MKTSLIALLLLTLLLVISASGQNMPRMTSVDPSTVKTGELLTVSGENLEKENVAEVFLTDGKTDLKVAISEQSATSMKVRIPDSAKPGRFSLMIRTAGSDEKYIEQPVRVNIE
jgi:hypothetical protein